MNRETGRMRGMDLGCTGVDRDRDGHAAAVRGAGARVGRDAVFVAPSGSDTGNCQTQGSPCATIGYAVSHAANGDTIQIGSGTYNEAITTSLQSLTLTGAGPAGSGKTLIDSTGKSASAVRVTGSGSVMVSDLALQTNDDGIGGALASQDSASLTGDDIAVTTSPTGTGSDGISADGASFMLTGPTVSVTNTDTAVANTSSGDVVDDGSGIEASAGTVSVATSTTATVLGIALRIHGSTSATTVRDSVLQSSGVEDIGSSQADYQWDQWPVIEAASGTLSVTGSTVYNASVGVISGSQTDGHTDGLWVPSQAGVSVAIKNSILQTQPNPNTSVYGAESTPPSR